MSSDWDLQSHLAPANLSRQHPAISNQDILSSGLSDKTFKVDHEYLIPSPIFIIIEPQQLEGCCSTQVQKTVFRDDRLADIVILNFLWMQF